MIEPYDIEDIKELVTTFGLPEILEPGIPANWPNRRLTRMILAWAHERARANKEEWVGNQRDYSRRLTDEDCVNTADWLNEVLDEIGWPEGQR